MQRTGTPTAAEQKSNKEPHGNEAAVNEQDAPDTLNGLLYSSL